MAVGQLPAVLGADPDAREAVARGFGGRFAGGPLCADAIKRRDGGVAEDLDLEVLDLQVRLPPRLEVVLPPLHVGIGPAHDHPRAAGGEHRARAQHEVEHGIKAPLVLRAIESKLVGLDVARVVGECQGAGERERKGQECGAERGGHGAVLRSEDNMRIDELNGIWLVVQELGARGAGGNWLCFVTTVFHGWM